MTAERLAVRTVQVTPLRQNCSIVSSVKAGRAIVIDPGGDVERLMDELADVHVEAILLTHGHLDHAGGAEGLRAGLSSRQGERVSLLGPDRRDAFLLQSIEKQAAAFGLSGMSSAFPDRYLEDGETLTLLDTVFEVAFVPGHSPGHVVFISRDNDLAIVGDTLFAGTIGRADFPYGDQAGLIAGIRNKLLTLPDHVTVLPGHGMPTTIGRERQSNPFLVQD